MNRLKELRLEKGLTQKELAKCFNKSQNCYSQYECETLDMPINFLIKIADYYNTSIDYILNLTDNKKRYKNSIMKNETSIRPHNRFKEIREDKDLLQEDIAKKLNVTKRGYSHIETGNCDISTDKLIKLAKFYNVSIDYLLYMTDERKPYKKCS